MNQSETLAIIEKIKTSVDYKDSHSLPIDLITAVQEAKISQDSKIAIIFTLNAIMPIIIGFSVKFRLHGSDLSLYQHGVFVGYTESMTTILWKLRETLEQNGDEFEFIEGLNKQLATLSNELDPEEQDES